jgi:hypothetical protein
VPITDLSDQLKTTNWCVLCLFLLSLRVSSISCVNMHVRYRLVTHDAWQHKLKLPLEMTNPRMLCRRYTLSGQVRGKPARGRVQMSFLWLFDVGKLLQTIQSKGRH